MMTKPHTPGLRQVSRRALALAAGRGQTPTTGDFSRALNEHGQGLAFDVLARLGLGRELLEPGSGQTGQPGATDILQRAEQASAELGHTFVGTEHLLVALASLPTTRLAAALAAEQIDAARLRATVAEVVRQMRSTADLEPVAPEILAGALTVPIAQTEESADLPLPAYQTEHAAGMDLLAAVPAETGVTLPPGQWALVPTGIKIALPPGFEAQVRPRSGLAARHGIGVLNAPGTIDADYRGEIKVILFNFSGEPFTILRGERIAQLVIARVESVLWHLSPELPASQRGAGGFGHTGR